MFQQLQRHSRLAVSASSALLVGGCAVAPGPYLGVTPPPEAGPAYTEDVSARADIFPITPQAIEKLHAEREAEQALRESQSPLPAVSSAPSTLPATGVSSISPASRALPASRTSAASPAPASPTSPSVDYQYLVGPQDILQITVWNHPELTNPGATANELSGRLVGADGYIFFPYAGRIRAAGRTVTDIRSELTRKLSAYLVEPQVDVSVSNYRSKRVFVVGQVATPGPVPLTDIPLTVTDLVANSGGFTPEADLRNAALSRDGQRRPLDLYALYYQGDMRQNLPLRPNDILSIPENRYNKVFVLGEVLAPQSIVMPRGRMSLAEAISDAGGFNPITANAGQVYVLRKGPENRPQIWHLNSKSPDALILADSFDLQPRDIVYVDPAGIARWNRVISNLLPSANLLDTVNR